MAGELKIFLLTLSVDPRIHQTIDIVVAHIPEAYGMWLTRNWLEKCKGCFSTDWSHLWLPYLGRPNKSKIMREPYLKQTVTDLNDPSEHVVYFSSHIEHYTFDTFFGNFLADSSTVEILKINLKLSIILLFHLLVPLYTMYIM